MRRHKLSVCIITYNEEENIGPCLDSAKWADEIVVIDSGSRDNTVPICRRYTDRVFISDWPGHVAQKNRAVQHASNEWVFCIDADERITDSLRFEIERILSGEHGHTGYTVPRLTRYLGRWIKHGSWYPDRKLRLFRRTKGEFRGKDPHDRAEVEGPAGSLKGDLLHFSYPDLTKHLETINRYTDKMAELKAEDGIKFPLFGMLVRPPAKFLKMYVLRAGFLDGIPGLIAACMGGVYEFMKYAKLWELRMVERTRNGV